MAIQMWQNKPYAYPGMLKKYEGMIFLTNLLIAKLEELDDKRPEVRDRLKAKISELLELGGDTFGSGY